MKKMFLFAMGAALVSWLMGGRYKPAEIVSLYKPPPAPPPVWTCKICEVMGREDACWSCGTEMVSA